MRDCHSTYPFSFTSGGGSSELESGEASVAEYGEESKEEGEGEGDSERADVCVRRARGEAHRSSSLVGALFPMRSSLSVGLATWTSKPPGSDSSSGRSVRR